MVRFKNVISNSSTLDYFSLKTLAKKKLTMTYGIYLTSTKRRNKLFIPLETKICFIGAEKILKKAYKLMGKTQKHTKKLSTQIDIVKYDVILKNVSSLVESGRKLAASTVNSIMTATYWEIGRHTVTYELEGKLRADW